MSEKLNPNQNNEAVKAIYDEALQAATDLLRKRERSVLLHSRIGSVKPAHTMTMVIAQYQSSA